ncbi:MAG: MGMT family protein [Chlamydiales bacterium]|nr:MGMT family protein [Chlamydiia bacterium]MCP5506944.1 MGMT family protein [Chlamydiales bacterium]
MLFIKITCEENCIIATSLSLSREMAWEIHGPASPELREKISLWMTQYSQKQQPTVALPIKIDHLPPFTKKTLSQLSIVPFAQAVTYQQLARSLDNPQAARAVGNSCGANPCPLIIPCHRVLAANGKLGGFSCGLPIKKALLAHEGIQLA